MLIFIRKNDIKNDVDILMGISNALSPSFQCFSCMIEDFESTLRTSMTFSISAAVLIH